MKLKRYFRLVYCQTCLPTKFTTLSIPSLKTLIGNYYTCTLGCTDELNITDPSFITNANFTKQVLDTGFPVFKQNGYDNLLSVVYTVFFSVLNAADITKTIVVLTATSAVIQAVTP